MATITEKLADLAAQSAQWIEHLDRGLITFDAYQSKLKAIETQTQAVTGSLEDVAASSEKVNTGLALQRDYTAQLAVENARFAARNNPQSVGGSRYIGTGDNAALNQTEAAFAGITDALIEGNQKIKAAYAKFADYKSDIAQLKTDEANALGQLQNTRDEQAFATDPNERARLEVEKAQWEAEALRLLNERTALQADYDQRFAALKNTVQTSTASTPPAKTYEIKFITAAGQSKTLTTTQNPEEFLAALEAAQRVT